MAQQLQDLALLDKVRAKLTQQRLQESAIIKKQLVSQRDQLSKVSRNSRSSRALAKTEKTEAVISRVQLQPLSASKNSLRKPDEVDFESLLGANRKAKLFELQQSQRKMPRAPSEAKARVHRLRHDKGLINQISLPKLMKQQNEDSHSTIDLPRVIREQMQDDDKFSRVFLNEESFLRSENRAKSVLTLGGKNLQQKVISRVKDNKLLAYHTIQNKPGDSQEPQPQHDGYSKLFQKLVPLKKSSLSPARGSAKPAFPLQLIEVRKHDEHQKCVCGTGRQCLAPTCQRQKLDEKMVSVINETVTHKAFDYSQGSKKFMENDLILRSKLSKIDSVVKSYFEAHSTFGLQNQIIKVKDVSELPKKKRNNAGPYSTLDYGRYGRQIHSVKRLASLENEKTIESFLNGNISLRDHQGIEISKKGTKLDSLARAAVSEVFEAEPKEEEVKLEDARISESESEFQEYILKGDQFIKNEKTSVDYIKEFLKKRKKQKKREGSTMHQKSTQRTPSSPFQNSQDPQLKNLKDMDTIVQATDAEKLLKLADQEDTKRQFSEDIKELTQNVRKYNELLQQRQFSKELKRKIPDFHGELTEQNQALLDLLPGDLQEEAIQKQQRQGQQGRGQRLPEHPKKDPPSHAQTRDLLTVQSAQPQSAYQDGGGVGPHFGSTMGGSSFFAGAEEYFDSQSTMGQTGMSQADVTSTLADFKQKLKEQENQKLPRKKKGQEEDLMEKLLRDQLKEKKQKQKLVLKQKSILSSKYSKLMVEDVDEELAKQDVEMQKKLMLSKVMTFTQKKVAKALKKQADTKEKSNFIMKKMVQQIKEQDQHQKTMKIAMEQMVKEKPSMDIEQPPDPPQQPDEDISELLSHIREKMHKKTEAQKNAEMKGLQVFLIECQKRKILTKQILKNLKNKTLKFVNSKIDPGLQKALQKFIAQGVQGGIAIDSVVFSHNNFSDEQLSDLLDPLSHEGAKPKSLVTVKNEVGAQSLGSIIKMIKAHCEYSEGGEGQNHNLTSLVLNDSKIKSLQMQADLLSALSSHCTKRLKYLGLSHLQIDDQTAIQLEQFVASSHSLKKLDLSFCKTTRFSLLLGVIQAMASENKSIQFLNLAGLPTTDRSMRIEFIESLVFLLRESQTLVHLNLSSCFPGLQVIKKKEDTDYCLMTVLFTAISKSKCLQSVHYSGNSINLNSMNAVNTLLKIENGSGFMMENNGMFGNLDHKMNMKDFNEYLLEKIERDEQKKSEVTVIQAFTKRQKLKAQAEAKTKLIQPPSNQYSGNHWGKRVDLRSEFEKKSGEDLANKEKISIDFSQAERNIPANDRFIYQRVLGHQEIRNGHRWALRNECWICSGWRYTLFVWSPSLAISGPLFQSKEPQWLTRWEDKIIDTNQLPSYKQMYDMDAYKEHIQEKEKDDKERLEAHLAHQEVHLCPRVMGPGTDYRIIPMTPMHQFVEKVLDNNRAWLRIYEREKEWKRVAEYRQKMTQPIADHLLRSSNREWPYTLRNYLKQFDMQSYLNISRLLKQGQRLDEQYYCYADIFPPAPASVILAVQSPGHNQISLMGHKFGYRESNPQAMMKRIKKRRLQRRFDLKKSLYHSWKVDLKQHYKKCFTADMKYSKIYKFVKDPKDFEAVSKVLLDNYELIFEQYLYGQGNSNYPSVSMIDFTNLCNMWGIVNKKDLSISDIDRLFFAVNFEEVGGSAGDLDDNPDKELCRYEFFEIIVRMAKLKYENQKLGLTVAQALQKLLDDYIFQMSLRQEWHGMRARDIWTLEVHDVLEANQGGIRQFMEWYIKTKSSKKGRKQVNLEDIYEMLASIPKGTIQQTLKEQLGMVDSQVTLSFANSKFVIIDEMKSAEQLMTIKYDEFLEFLVRVADLANFSGDNAQARGWTDGNSEFENSDKEEEDKEEEKEAKPEAQSPPQQKQLIQDKVFLVIDLFLRLIREPGVNLRAVRPTIQGLADSESDYDSL